MAKHKLFLITFLALAFLATLFPPFYWEPERRGPDAVEYAASDVPPKYALIFDDATKEKSPDGWTTVTFTRKLIVSELVAEYILALLVAFIIQVVLLKTRSLLKRRA